MRDNKDVRIFFALWPDASTRRGLESRAAGLRLPRPARAVPEYNLHLTLHFIGNVLYQDLDCMQQAARSVVADRFELCIDCHGFFARPRVGWLGCSEVPAALHDLHAALGTSLKPCAYRVEKRPYQPHVTVARKLSAPPRAAPFEPLRWNVDNFVLIESRAVDGGVRYAVIETYPLS